MRIGRRDRDAAIERSTTLEAPDEPLTLLSIAIAVTVSIAGFSLVLRGSAIGGGSLVGLSIAGMHYVGMMALAGPFAFQWAPAYVVASVALSLGFSILAAFLTSAYKDELDRVVALA